MLIQLREQHSTIDATLLMEDGVAMLDKENPDPEWIQVSDAGVLEVNGLYKRAPGPKQTIGDAAKAPHKALSQSNVGIDQSIEDKNLQLRLLLEGDVTNVDLSALGINLMKQLHSSEHMRWHNGQYTLVLEPWGIEVDGIATPKKQRYAIFSDKQGVTGYMPYYEAFQSDATGSISRAATDHGHKWEWSLGPAGIHPPPRVQPFFWQGGFTP